MKTYKLLFFTIIKMEFEKILQQTDREIQYSFLYAISLQVFKKDRNSIKKSLNKINLESKYNTQFC